MKTEPNVLAADGVAVPGTALTRDRWSLAAGLAVAAIVWLLAWYWTTAASVVAIWERSDTYAHGYLILPICLWLVWRKRELLADMEPRPQFLALPLLALAGAAWLVARAAGTGVVQQYGLALMIPLVVWSILGRQVAQVLAFPLFFLIFAVPFGEFLVPPLMEHTAEFTVFALRLTGIPVYREGLFFTIPSGSWSVIEACSGLRYLIASVTLGVLYAYLTYRSLARRVIFIVFSALVPIVANWLRAYMIVMIGHLSGMKYAMGVDHLVYGWVLFGIVMLMLFWAGSFWREDLDRIETDRWPLAAARTAADMRAMTGMLGATVAAATLVAIWPAAADRLEGAIVDARPGLEVPATAGDWGRLPGRLTSWSPGYYGTRVQVDSAYSKGEHRVGLFIGYYRHQRPGAALISTANVLTQGREWIGSGEGMAAAGTEGNRFSAMEAKLRSPTTALLVWQWYWVDGRYTASPYLAKLLQAKSTLFGRGDDGAVVIIYAPYQAAPQEAERALREFSKGMLASITRSLENAR